jgi:D-alanyl-D-alanine carboxypeptidase (penicillin-binding protein 5/6)
MNQQRSGRLKFFIGILITIIVLHIIVLALIVNSSGSETEKKEDKKASALPVSPVEKSAKPVTKKPVWRYRKRSADPRFGTPFNYSGARRNIGNIIPGDTATTGILVDMNTRRVLWEKNSNRPVAVASMSKMMTLLLVMEHLEARPGLTLDSPIKISKTVLTLPRSGVIWLDPRETFSYADLIRCAAIKSANDAALQLALTVSGNEKSFVSLMNRKARRLNMTRTTFINAHGLPAPEGHSLSTAYDMVLLAERLLEYPFLMQCSATPHSSIRTGDRKTVFKNSNNLIRRNFRGMEGMKTGFTRKAGFCLAFSVKRDGRRLMGCVTGFKSSSERDSFCSNLIEWAYKGCPDKPIRQKVIKSASRKQIRAKKNIRN